MKYGNHSTSNHSTSNHSTNDQSVKVVGYDRELGSNIIGKQSTGRTTTCDEGARLIQREIRGVKRSSCDTYSYNYNYDHGYGALYYGFGSLYGIVPSTPVVGIGNNRPAVARSNPQDYSGKFLDNRGCVYIDMGHPEICTPECFSARESTLYVHAMIRIARLAAEQANRKLPEGQSIFLFNDNTDRQGNAYGSHISVQMSRAAMDDMFSRRMFPHLAFLASFQASSIVLTGGGKVGTELKGRPAPYHISRRAEFIETMLGEQTTYNRPMVNSRDEALGDTARLHIIFYDAVLLHGTNYLQTGMLQIICAMIEAGPEFMPASLLLDNPLQALQTWTRDPLLKTKKALMGSAKKLTAVEHNALFFEQAKRFVDADKCVGFVADAEAIIAYWGETLQWLLTRNYESAARRIEWLAKFHFLNECLDQHQLTWHSNEIKQLDLMFSELDPTRGIYWQLEQAGQVETLFDEAAIHHATGEPPTHTRAWTRGKLVQHASDRIINVNWDRITYKTPEGYQRTVKLPSPEGYTKEDYAESLFYQPDEVFEQLHSCDTPSQSTATAH